MSLRWREAQKRRTQAKHHNNSAHACREKRCFCTQMRAIVRAARRVRLRRAIDSSARVRRGHCELRGATPTQHSALKHHKSACHACATVEPRSRRCAGQRTPPAKRVDAHARRHTRRIHRSYGHQAPPTTSIDHSHNLRSLMARCSATRTSGRRRRMRGAHARSHTRASDAAMASNNPTSHHKTTAQPIQRNTNNHSLFFPCFLCCVLARLLHRPTACNLVL